MKIAIVEDEDLYFEQLNSYLIRIQQEENFEGEIFELSRFKSGEEFISSFSPNYYDLLLADIGLPDMNGINMCEKIRESDQRVVISFITSLSQYAIQGYTVNAVDYILKPIQYESFKIKFLRIFKIALKNVHIHKKFTFYDKDRKAYLISKNEIIFIEVSGHKLTFHTTKGVFSEFNSLRLYEEELANSGKDNKFLKCNNCYLVNLGYVDRYTKDFVYVKSGSEEHGLIISRNKRKQFVDTLKSMTIKKSQEGR